VVSDSSERKIRLGSSEGRNLSKLHVLVSSTIRKYCDFRSDAHNIPYGTLRTTAIREYCNFTSDDHIED
jgi:hypothetical protein